MSLENIIQNLQTALDKALAERKQGPCIYLNRICKEALGFKSDCNDPEFMTNWIITELKEGKKRNGNKVGAISRGPQ